MNAVMRVAGILGLTPPSLRRRRESGERSCQALDRVIDEPSLALVHRHPDPRSAHPALATVAPSAAPHRARPSLANARPASGARIAALLPHLSALVLAVLFVLALTVITAAGCSTSVSSPEPGTIGTLIDVRTPEEFAEGHLEGAINVDVASPRFADDILALDPTEPVVVYCRSGNRSARAQTLLEEAGIANVINAGGLNDAAQALNLAVVTD